MARWRSEYRPYLVERITYTPLSTTFDVEQGLPKLGSLAQAEVLRAVVRGVATHANNPVVLRKSKYRLGFSQAARNFVSAFLEEPPCLDEQTLKIQVSPKIGFLPVRDEKLLLASLASILGELYLWHWLVVGDGFDVTSWMVSGHINTLSACPPHILDLLSQVGTLLHSRRYEALAFKKNAGMYVGNFNYSGFRSLTRRSDLLILAGLGLEKAHALDVLNYVARVLSINVFAGEKAIPAHVKAKFPPQPVDEVAQKHLLDEIDRVLARHYGFTDEELDFILNYDIKYRMGKDAEEGEEE